MFSEASTRLLRLGAPALGALIVSTASAAECEAVYTVDNLLTDLVEVESLMRAGDDSGAGPAGDKLLNGIQCLDEAVPSMIAGRTFRAIAMGLYATGDESNGGRWFRTAIDAEPGFEYGMEDMGETHPARNGYLFARDHSGVSRVLLEGKVFAPGDHYVDGKKTSLPTARPDRFHLYQRDHEGTMVGSVIDGNGFPEDAVQEENIEVVVLTNKTKKEKKEKKPKGEKEPKEEAVVADAEPNPLGSGVTVLKRERPPEKTPLMIGGGVILAGAGGLYALSYGSRRSFDGAKTQDEIDTLQSKTNTLFLVSAGVFAAGAGTLSWGIIVDGGAPGPSVNFRF
jgi:hypothetical protein